MNFENALTLLKEGKKIAREGWNGKGMFLYMVPVGEYLPRTEIAQSITNEEGLVPYGAYAAIKGADGIVYPWVPSQQDMFATDWVACE